MRKRKKPGNLNPDEDFYDSMPRVMAAIASGHYPSPPARELYFVAKGKPESALDPLSSTCGSGIKFRKMSIGSSVPP